MHQVTGERGVGADGGLDRLRLFEQQRPSVLFQQLRHLRGHLGTGLEHSERWHHLRHRLRHHVGNQHGAYVFFPWGLRSRLRPLLVPLGC